MAKGVKTPSSYQFDMPIPDYQTLMLPLLRFLGDQKEHSFREAIDYLSKEFQLSEQEKNELLPSGQQPKIDNRIGWARAYILKAGLVESPRRGYMKISLKGLDVLNKKPTKIDIKYLEQFPEFIEFRKLRNEIEDKGTNNPHESENIMKDTPDQIIDSQMNSINAILAQDLLEGIRKNTPQFFEKLVLKLLSEMNYGKGSVVGRSGDGGVDGFISQDALGLDKIFFQAKRFGEGNPVSASMLRDFIGTLEVNSVNKGVFMTTSYFPRDAEAVISKSHKSIVLIDGAKLVKLMIEHNVGVLEERAVKIKKIDADFFLEE